MLLPASRRPSSDSPQERYARALAYLQAGQAEAAAELLQPLADQNPDSGPLWVNAAAAWTECGDGERAFAAASHSVELLPRDADAWSNLGLAQRLLGEAWAAAENFERAISLAPRHPNAWLQLALCYETAGDLDAGLMILDDQLQYWQHVVGEDDPRRGDAAIFVCLMQVAAGRMLLQKRLARAAYRVLSDAVTFDPQSSEANNLLGVTLRQLGRPGEALTFYRRAVAIHPGYAAAHLNLSHVARQLGRTDLAQRHAERALTLRPGWPAAGNALSSALRGQGRVEDAVAVLEGVLEDPIPLRKLSNLLSLQQYRDGQTRQSLAREHERFTAAYRDQFGPPESMHFANARPSSRGPLRVGLLSPDFGRHPVGYFLAGLLPELRDQDVEAFCYSDRGFADDMTGELKRAAADWRESASLSDAELARQIRRDRVDVLIDLAGHTEGHRLELFAERAAPTQLSWMGYVGTLGVPNIDGLIADQHHVPSEHEADYPETIFRMPATYVCYRPPHDLPPIEPRDPSAPTVLAAFHNPAKISPATVALWATALRELPEAVLRLQYWGFDSAATRRHFTAAFAAEGVGSERLEFRGASSQQRLLMNYGRVTLQLDPLPYSGGLTTVEALMMGVPVVSCPGETFASRHAGSYLHTIGRSEWVAESRERYLDIVVRLARDEERLMQERMQLRGAVASSPLCDYTQFARDFSALLRRAAGARETPGDDLLAKFCA